MKNLADETQALAATARKNLCDIKHDALQVQVRKNQELTMLLRELRQEYAIASNLAGHPPVPRKFAEMLVRIDTIIRMDLIDTEVKGKQHHLVRCPI